MSTNKRDDLLADYKELLRKPKLTRIEAGKLLYFARQLTNYKVPDTVYFKVLDGWQPEYDLTDAKAYLRYYWTEQAKEDAAKYGIDAIKQFARLRMHLREIVLDIKKLPKQRQEQVAEHAPLQILDAIFRIPMRKGGSPDLSLIHI